MAAVPGQAASLADWIAAGEERFRDAVFRDVFLRETARRVDDLPCPDGCGCRHVRRKNPYDGGLRAVCQCRPRECEPLDVEETDFAVWELRIDGLCRALAGVLQAVGGRGAMLLPKGVHLVGAWPKDGAVRRSVFLCLPYDHDSEAVTINALLAAHGGFILLVPTALPSSAAALNAKDCACVDLSVAVRVTDDGRMMATDEPWRLFGIEASELVRDDEAKQKALVKLMLWAQEMDANPLLKPPDHFTVLRLYCHEELSVGQIAKRYSRASLSTVKNRRAALEKSAGASLDQFRNMSGVFDQFEKTCEKTGNPKAYRKAIAE